MKSFGLQNLNGILVAMLLVWTSGCQTAPKRREFAELTPTQRVRYACEVGARLLRADGSAAMSARTREFSGQFKAEIAAVRDGETLIEAQNPLGGTEVVARGKGNEFSLEFPKEPIRNQKGQFQWAGVPVRHLRSLFLGRIPCPQGKTTEEGDTLVDERGEVFDFYFRSESNQPWPESLEWKASRTSPYSVRFDFDKPEGDDLVPRQWQARSGDNEVTVKWRIRKLTRSDAGSK